MTNVTHAGQEHIERWMRANSALALAQQCVVAAQAEVADSTKLLAEWLLPHDAKTDEKFCVWYGDSLITASMPNAVPIGDGPYVVKIRTRGRSLNFV